MGYDISQWGVSAIGPEGETGWNADRRREGRNISVLSKIQSQGSLENDKPNK